MSQKLLTGPGPCTEPGVCSRSDSLSPMMMMMMMKKKMEGNIPMSGKMAMPMTQNMANGKLLNFLNDRELVVKIAKKHRELSFSEHVQRQYDKLDPSSPSVMLETMMIWSDTANRVLKEMCPEFPDVKATPICLFAMEMLVQKYEKDPEVRRHLDFMYEFRSMMQSGKLQPGDKVPDVGIVDVETKEAIVDGGSLSKLFADYKSTVDFLFVYLVEAHPRDGFKMGTNFSFMNQHKVLDDRIDCARAMVNRAGDLFTFDMSSDTKISVAVDSMENSFNRAFHAHPDRAFIVENGKMVYIGDTMIEQLKMPHMNVTDHLRTWLDSRFTEQ